jgi:hypothetical protein
MMYEDNAKVLATGLRRQGIMGHEVPQVEKQLADGKTVKEIADQFLCEESVIESFRDAYEAKTKPKEAEEEQEQEYHGGKRGRK